MNNETREVYELLLKLASSEVSCLKEAYVRTSVLLDNVVEESNKDILMETLDKIEKKLNVQRNLCEIYKSLLKGE